MTFSGRLFHKFTILFTVWAVYIGVCPFQPVTLTHILENINLFFAAFFGVEMVLKVVGHGLYGYIQDGFNMFDGFIVLLRYRRSGFLILAVFL